MNSFENPSYLYIKFIALKAMARIHGVINALINQKIQKFL